MAEFQGNGSSEKKNMWKKSLIQIMANSSGNSEGNCDSEK